MAGNVHTNGLEATSRRFVLLQQDLDRLDIGTRHPLRFGLMPFHPELGEILHQQLAMDAEGTRHQAAHLMRRERLPVVGPDRLEGGRCQSSGRIGKKRPGPVSRKSPTTERTHAATCRCPA